MENTRSNSDLILGSLAIVAAVAVALSPAACVMHRDTQIAAAIKAGADPIAARCALTGANTGIEIVMCSGAKK